MTENKEIPTPSLSQYFGSASGTDQADFTSQLVETSKKLDDLKLDESSSEAFKKNQVIYKSFYDSSRNMKEAAQFFDYFGSNRYGNLLNFDNIQTDTTVNDCYEPTVAISSAGQRSRDAWIPSEKTRQILIKVATSQPGSFIPEQEYLTMPGVFIEEELGDSLGEAIAACLGEAEAAERRIITANDVTQDERGLRELMQAGAYRAAINLTGRLLEVYGQGKGRVGYPGKHSRRSLQIWFTRIALLIKTRAYAIAEAEAEAFGNLDQPDVFYQFYPELYGDRPGSIAPFAFRLLLAELPMHCKKYASSIPKLCNLYGVARQILKNLEAGLCEDGNPLEIGEEDRLRSLKVWSYRVDRIYISLVNCNILSQDFPLAIELIKEGDIPPGFTDYTVLSRMHMAMGDLENAEHYMNMAEMYVKKTGEKMVDSKQMVQFLLEKALICIAKSCYEEALDFLQEALNLDSTNTTILNNMSICYTNLGRVKEAIGCLEKAIEVNPARALSEPLITNLCTLYDMESSQGRMKKFALLKKLSQYHIDAPKTLLEKLCG